jgi:hypothetical protein
VNSPSARPSLLTANSLPNRTGIFLTFRPYVSPYTVDQARTLLTQKLQDILLSTQNVQQSDRWTKQILHVLAYATQHVSALQEAYASIDLATRANTIVYITCTDGNDQFLY